LIVKPEGKRQFGRPKRKWVDKVKIEVKEIRRRRGTGLIWLRIERSGLLFRTPL
jgi:hypothetical protein